MLLDDNPLEEGSTGSLELATQSVQASRDLLFAIIAMAPIFFLPALFALIAWLLRLCGFFSDASQRLVVLEVCFFSVIGSTMAFMVNLSIENVLPFLMPQIIVALVFASQLIGLSRGQSPVPLASRRVLLAGLGASVCFIVAFRYLQYST